MLRGLAAIDLPVPSGSGQARYRWRALLRSCQLPDAILDLTSKTTLPAMVPPVLSSPKVSACSFIVVFSRLQKLILHE